MDIGKLLIWAGLGIALVGVCFWLGSKMGIFLGKLPGDLQFKTGNFSVYVPIVTSIILSLILTIGINLLLWIFKK